MAAWDPRETLDSIGLGRTTVKRAVKVADVIKNELSILLVSKVRDEKLSGVSISRVEVTDDLKLARIFYTIFEGAKNRGQVQKSLDKAKGFMRSHLARTMNMRYTPELQFRYDDKADKVRELEELFQEISDERKNEQ